MSHTPGHTPGPWETNGTTIETMATPYVVIGRAYDPEDSAGGVETNSEAEANARLIAAAPEMLDFTRDVGGQDDWFERTADLNTLRAALREFRDKARVLLAKVESK